MLFHPSVAQNRGATSYMVRRTLWWSRFCSSTWSGGTSFMSHLGVGAWPLGTRARSEGPPSTRRDGPSGSVWRFDVFPSSSPLSWIVPHPHQLLILGFEVSTYSSRDDVLGAGGPFTTPFSFLARHCGPIVLFRWCREWDPFCLILCM